MEKTKFRKITLGLAAVLVAGIVLYAVQAPAKPPQYITATVERGDIENAVLATGTLEGIRQVDVGAQVSGQLKSLKVKLGDKVSEGQWLAEIDPLVPQNTLRQAEVDEEKLQAERRSVQAKLKQARRVYERYEVLQDDESISRQDFESAESEFEVQQANLRSLDAQIKSARVQIDTARVNLGYTRIVSPSDGYIVAIVTKAGQTLNSMQTTPTIVMLAQMDTMTVRTEIAEADVELIAPGQPLWFSTLGPGGRRYESHLQQLEPAPSSIADVATGNTGGSAQTPKAVYYAGLFDVPNPGLKLKPSMTVKVTIQLARAANALQVPLTAVSERDDKAGNRATVQVIDAKGRAHERAVTTGLRTATAVQILSGLKAGENVVIGQAPSGAEAESASLLGM